MYYQRLVIPILLLGLWTSCAAAQTSPKPVDPPRAAATFDAAGIRRQAAQMAEFRGLLSDPDPIVRLLTLREAIRAGNELQRRTAIDFGLASSETPMVEQALRGVMMNTRQILMEFVDGDGKPVTTGNTASLTIPISKFDPETGQLDGALLCSRQWSGQLQGLVISFNDTQSVCSGSLSWSAETGDFRGRINLNQGQREANRNVIWKPQ